MKRFSTLPKFITLIFSISMGFFIIQPITPAVNGIPIQVLLVWIVFLWVFLFRTPLVLESLKNFSHVQKLTICIILGSILLKTIDNDSEFERVGQLVTGIMIALIGIIAIKRAAGIKILFGSLLLVASASNLWAALQGVGLITWRWHSTVYDSAGFAYGATGMEISQVAYPFSVLAIGICCVSSWLIMLNNNIKILPFKQILLFVVSIIFMLGLLASKSRSGIVGLLIGIIFITMFFKKIRLKFPTFLILFVCVFILGLGLTIRGEKLSDDARFVDNWNVYLPIILKNPLGMSGRVRDIEYILNDSYYSINEAGYGASLHRLSINYPHNIFLTTSFEYGVPAGLALLFLYLYTFTKAIRFFTELRKRNRLFSRPPNGSVASAKFRSSKQMTIQSVWVIILIGANISIFIHSWFHNANIITGEMRNWLWLGLLIASIRHPATRSQGPGALRSHSGSLLPPG